MSVGFYGFHVPTQSLFSGWPDPAVDKNNNEQTEDWGGRPVISNNIFFSKKAWGFQIWLETGLDVYFPHCLSGKKGWVIQTAASAFGLGPWVCLHSVLCSSGDQCQTGEKQHITSHICSKLPASIAQRRDQRSVLKEQKVGEETRKEKVLPGMRREKGQGLQGKLLSSPPSSTPSICPGSPTLRTGGRAKVTRRHLRGLPGSITALPAARTPAGIRGPDL